MEHKNSNSSSVAKQFKAKTEELLALVNGAENQEAWDEVDANDIQRLFECLLKMYAHKVRMTDHRDIEYNDVVQPLAKDNQLSQTDAVIFVDQLLMLKDIELFEVQMWRSSS